MKKFSFIILFLTLVSCSNSASSQSTSINNSNNMTIESTTPISYKTSGTLFEITNITFEDIYYVDDYNLYTRESIEMFYNDINQEYERVENNDMYLFHANSFSDIVYFNNKTQQYENLFMFYQVLDYKLCFKAKNLGLNKNEYYQSKEPLRLNFSLYEKNSEYTYYHDQNKLVPNRPSKNTGTFKEIINLEINDFIYVELIPYHRSITWEFSTENILKFMEDINIEYELVLVEEFCNDLVFYEQLERLEIYEYVLMAYFDYNLYDVCYIVLFIYENRIYFRGSGLELEEFYVSKEEVSINLYDY